MLNAEPPPPCAPMLLKRGFWPERKTWGKLGKGQSTIMSKLEQFLRCGEMTSKCDIRGNIVGRFGNRFSFMKLSSLLLTDFAMTFTLKLKAKTAVPS
mmetsp:Transcript_46805/g.50492  ORF Transcript_46805/g.50492 Transcript_46805/m.50492 type:complete len:97 (-) Transcript_46805:4686-4976(-)